MSFPSKPLYGAVCNGCGLCCAQELCRVGELLYPGANAPCPSLKLTPDGSRTYCDLVATEIAYDMPPLIQAALGIGRGCSMQDDG